jgi:sigma-B regulation protein RsbU (phosphoserine phosphatase)
MADNPDPGSLFEALNERILAQGGSERFVRLLLAIYDPERASLDYVNAGHVPPIVYRSGVGEVEWLGEGGMALGIERDAQFKVGRIDLEPGDMLILYTDGVTEAPRDRRPFGQARLADLILRYGVGTPGELVQGIRRSVDAWVGVGELRDDLVLLVTQVVPDSLIGEPTRELVLPNEPARMGEIRSFVAGFLADVRAPVDPSHEILLAVGEAAANSCRHGRVPTKRSELRIRCALESETVTVTVADEGPGFDPEEIDARLPDRFASGGRGLFLMKELMDTVDISSTGEGTTVQLKRRLF